MVLEHAQSQLLTSPNRLQKIDHLRSKNIGAYIPLPQLVAVGDQSSGKSSLLETLTGIPFPRGQELCTRYATQITHRREDHPCINISIIPGPNARPEEKRQLESYCREVQTTAQLRADFATILNEVNELMDIRTSENPNGEKTFSEDVLLIEKRGPNEDYLTIIDVPGIFRSTTEGITTKNDVHLVKDMVKRYISDKRTIILAVLPSTVDVATQEIIEFAEEVDKTGERTLGILTKPDLLKEHSSKLSICNLVQGRRKPLNLGYYVVRNRGGDDDDGDEASNSVSALREREAMFNESPWNKLPEDRLGASALRERLEELLGQITDRAFPQLRAETRGMLEAAQKELKQLGPPRQTEREQQMYLTGIASEFQRLVRAALDADYSAHPALARDDMRLITSVVIITEQFNIDFDKYGQTYFFESEETLNAAALTNDVEIENDSRFGSDDEDFPDPDCPNIPKPDTYPDLDKVIVTDWTMKGPDSGILDWIELVYRRSRGLELGTFSQRILSSVVREQSAKWESMAKQYVSKVILVIHRFILGALDVVCKDAQVREELSSVLLNDILHKYECGMEQAILLVNVERQLQPYTLDRQFNFNCQKSYGKRLTETLRPQARKEANTQWSKLIVDLNRVADAVSNKSNAGHVKEKIHDILEAYYNVAYKRFVDNVYSQAVDYRLLSGRLSPLWLFSEQWVLQLDEESLLAVAGESRRTREKRQRLQRKIEDLEGAMRILR